MFMSQRGYVVPMGNRNAQKQSEGQSGWLPAAFGENRIHLLYSIVEQEAFEVGCSLRSGVEEFSIDLDNRYILIDGSQVPLSCDKNDCFSRNGGSYPNTWPGEKDFWAPDIILQFKNNFHFPRGISTNCVSLCLSLTTWACSPHILPKEKVLMSYSFPVML